MLFLAACHPNPKNILEKSFEKCQSIKNGHYEMRKYLKLMSSIDTLMFTHTTDFLKLDNDSLYSFAFHSHLSSETTGDLNLIYTGDSVAVYTGSMGQFVSVKNNENIIKNNYIKNLPFSPYWPVTNNDSYPLPNSLILNLDSVDIQFIGNEIVENIQCYHIKVKTSPDYDKSTIKHLVEKLEYNYWISREDYIPVQFTISRDIKLEKHTTNEYEKYTLTKYEFNKFNDKSAFTLQSIPSHVAMSEFVELPNQSLEIGEIAPDWNLKSTQDEAFILSDMKENLILLDFFYNSCPPCIDILHDLNYLHEKYGKDGLKVFGINSTNNRKEIDYFINRYGVEYPVLIGNEETPRQYQVFAYPSSFLIDTNGKIIYQHVGPFSNDEKLKLEKIIVENL